MKVVCKESVLVPALELFDGGKARLEDVVVDGGEVALVELELAGTDRKEVGSSKRLGEVRDVKVQWP